MIEIHSHTDIDPMLKQIDYHATQAINDHKSFYVEWGRDKSMTNKQRNSLHVWCDQVSKVLNDAGQYRKKIHPFTGVEVEVEWSKETVKEDLYKPTLKSFCDKASTEDQSTAEPSLIAEALARAYSLKLGVVLPFWPSRS